MKSRLTNAVAHFAELPNAFEYNQGLTYPGTINGKVNEKIYSENITTSPKFDFSFEVAGPCPCSQIFSSNLLATHPLFAISATPKQAISNRYRGMTCNVSTKFLMFDALKQ